MFKCRVSWGLLLLCVRMVHGNCQQHGTMHIGQEAVRQCTAQFAWLNEALVMQETSVSRAPQKVGGTFLGATLADSGYFPPDSMGAVGPTQYILAINGVIRSFNKTTLTADGVINISTDSFFVSVSDGNSTTDPRIRYDRLSGRWFITMITETESQENNTLMIAVSDDSTITGSTNWSLFSISIGAGNFLDYPTLGIDANALYIGGKFFSDTISNRVHVVRKSSILGDGPLVYTTFDNLPGASIPQGVDNQFDASPTYGYFVDVDSSFFGLLVLYRISNADSMPTISDPIYLSVPATSYPIRVPHKGNLRGRAGNLDAIDDRLFMAHIRNGSLWTAHNISVNNKGVAGTAFPSRNACRWYEIVVSTPTPTVRQAGTLYFPSVSNTTDQRSYWMPSLMTSGQGHMALGCSAAGLNERINAATAGRLAGDALGALRAPVLYTTSSTAYNPPGDPGDLSVGRRWGDFSYTCVDPCDDMTIWMIQEYCNANNSWGCAVAKLQAPPPAAISSVSPNPVAHGQASVTVTVHGTSVSGSGFFDPGAGFSCRLAAQLDGGVVVSSVTYVNPTTVQLQLNTVGAAVGARTLTITNPDGQAVSLIGALTIS